MVPAFGANTDSWASGAGRNRTVEGHIFSVVRLPTASATPSSADAAIQTQGDSVTVSHFRSLNYIGLLCANVLALLT